jgi:hypothetical protein
MPNIYYYVHTGHRFGLDRFRRAVAIVEALSDLNITLLTSDYRITSSAREFGIQKSIGIDVLRNIPNVAEHGDILIYDSDEHNEQQLIDMTHFFSKFFRVSINPNDYRRDGEFLINPYVKDSEFSLSATAIRKIFFEHVEKIEKNPLLFFGDDDYDKDLLTYKSDLKDFGFDNLLGFYYFLGYEDELKPIFKEIYETEDYDEVIQKRDVIITASYQTALESLASGGKPIYIERSDRTDEPNKLLESLGIPVLKSFDKNDISKVLSSELNSYKRLENMNSKIADFIKSKL